MIELIGASATIILYIIAIGWIWNNLGDIDKIKKVIIITFELVAMYLITLIIFLTSKEEMHYINKDAESYIGNTLVTIFMGINSLIVLPFINKKIVEFNEEKEVLTQRSTLIKIIIFLVVFIVGISLERGYMNQFQKGFSEIEKSHSQLEKNNNS